MTALLVGLFIGFIMCIPVGPINIWVINTLLKHNFRSAFSIALGGAVMDFVYFMVILSGLAFFKFSPQSVFIFKILGVFFLMIIGLKEIFQPKTSMGVSDGKLKKIPHASSFFFIGVLIYTSNPTLIATMTGLAALIKSWHLFQESVLNHSLLSFGVATGSALWFFVLLKTVTKYQKKISAKLYTNFARTSGFLIVALSLYMAFNVYKEVRL